MLLQLKRRGWDVRILGCTVFDSERGMTLLKPHLDPKPTTRFVKVKDPDGLDHTLVVTQSIHAKETTNDELNQLFSLYLTTLDEFQPDFVFFYGGNAFDLLIADEARCRNIKTVAYLANSNYLGSTRWCRDVDLILTNTKATARFYKEKMQLEVTPVGIFVEPGKVVADHHERKHILFINPSFEKGGAFVAQLAWLMSKRRPDITFEVVESRGLWQPILHAVMKTLGEDRHELPNVIVTPNQADMRVVYARARLVLMPSLCWETAGRVLAEAMLNGIPAIITDHGGMPEMIEDGGIKFKLDPDLHEPPYTKIPKASLLGPLIDRIIALYDNEPLYRAFCERAWRVAQRIHNIDRNTDRLIEVLEKLKRKPDKHKTRKFHKQPQARVKQAPFTHERVWQEICARFPMFAPNSADWTGGLQARAELTAQAAPATFSALEALAAKLTGVPSLQPQPLSALRLDEGQREFAAVMAERFHHYGSDKARVHGYEQLYAWLLAKMRDHEGSLLEIGLGTNNVDTPSNMGAAGKPGASVRAFRDVLPYFQIYGADVDRRILFEEERLRTFYVDQTNGKTLRDLQRQIGTPLDVIIDDGLHAPHSQLNTLLFALEALRPGGYLVVEDIMPPQLPIWRVAGSLLQGLGHDVTIYQCRAALALLLRK
ncbi:glycosyltransferase [Desulfosoma caldarium]|uniref:Glycosyl transferase family 1 n=1 Tax=Desulfosoma caldarium TaxID=610254 RepID=A0A3N1VK12_9BACT|nr:glycosyltransferase [Desulfosoma caldarium]ROR03154.1 glycosyl transferase family 1 [Desulfosoma caldarium]